MTAKQIALFLMIIRQIKKMSLIIAFLISVLFLINFIQVKLVHPQESPQLEQMINQYQDNNGNNQLAENIQALDLIARKAWFNWQWQVYTFGIILLICLLLFFSTSQLLIIMAKTNPQVNFQTQKKKNTINQASLYYSFFVLFFLSTFFIIWLTNQDFIASPLSRTRVKPLKTVAKNLLQKNWIAFRGYHSQGIGYEQNPPFNWDAESNKNILWKIPLPKPGFSSPIIFKNRVFLTGGDKESRNIYCFKIENGELLWEYQIADLSSENNNFPQVTEDTGYAAATMTTNGVYVYAIFSTGILICLDFSGKLIWQRDLGVPDNHYGHSSSLLTYEDQLLVQLDDNSNARLLSYHAGSGNLKWEVKRDVIASWSSPVLVEYEEKPLILVSADPYAAAYQINDGTELFAIECMFGEIGASAAYADGIGYFGNKFATLAAIDLKTRSIIWEYFDQLPEVASLLATSQFLVMAASNGTVTCLDAKQGKMIWEQSFSSGFYSSPILINNLVYLTDRQGKTIIFSLGDFFEQKGEGNIGEPCDATPAFFDDKILIRGYQHLFCINQ
ncbi:MAG: PQQ-like beta-propeller repeat protein [Spirochaetes bacterium]|nr:PQQ-like beta-propeller repeat protein [Spirochaetota bacterium]